MSNFRTKAISVAISVTTVISLSGVAMLPVQAQTTADLQAQIDALLASIAVLQGKLAVSSSSSTVGCTFARNLTVGVSGDDVKCLQNALKAGGMFSATATGYFGPITQAAVAAWQTANGVSPATGYFGAISRAKYAAMNTGTTTVVLGFPAGCTSNSGYSVTTGMSCAVATNFPAGCTSTAGYSPTTGLSCGTVAPVVVSNTGIEGSMSVKLSAFPADLTEVKEGESNVAVVAYDVKALNNDIILNRLDLNFNKRPWQSWTNLSLYDGSNLLKSVDLNAAAFNEIAAGTSYDIRLSGFSLAVTKDTTKTVTVKLSAPTLSESGALNIAINTNANAFRAIDATGKTQDAPTAALAQRTVRFLAKATGNLEVIVSSNQPKERSVAVTDTGTTEFELFRFDLKATNSAIKPATITVKLSTSSPYGSSTLLSIVDTAKLYVDGVADAVAAATPLVTGSTTFADLINKVSIDKDATKTMIVKVVVKKRTGNYAPGEALLGAVPAINATDIAAQDANFKDATVSGSAVTGKLAHLFVVAPVFAFKSSNIASTINNSYTTGTASIANANIKFSVTAVGGNIYLKKYSATAGSSGVIASTTPYATSAASTTYSLATYADGVTTAADAGSGVNPGNWVVPSGQTKLFDVAINTHNGNTAGFYRNYLVNLKWVVADDDLVAATTTAWGLDDFKTSDVNLEKDNAF